MKCARAFQNKTEETIKLVESGLGLDTNSDTDTGWGSDWEHLDLQVFSKSEPGQWL